MRGEERGKREPGWHLSLRKQSLQLAASVPQSGQKLSSPRLVPQKDSQSPTVSLAGLSKSTKRLDVSYAELPHSCRRQTSNRHQGYKYEGSNRFREPRRPFLIMLQNNDRHRDKDKDQERELPASVRNIWMFSNHSC